MCSNSTHTTSPQQWHHPPFTKLSQQPSPDQHALLVREVCKALTALLQLFVKVVPKCAGASLGQQQSLTQALSAATSTMSSVEILFSSLAAAADGASLLEQNPGVFGCVLVGGRSGAGGGRGGCPFRLVCTDRMHKTGVTAMHTVCAAFNETNAYHATRSFPHYHHATSSSQPTCLMPTHQLVIVLTHQLRPH